VDSELKHVDAVVLLQGPALDVLAVHTQLIFLVCTTAVTVPGSVTVFFLVGKSFLAA